LPQRQRHLERRFRTPAGNDDSRGPFAEADQLRILPCSRREPLRPDVQRLEQVRLADAVRPDRQDDPVRERQVERRVRPVLAERELVDQPASRIGMIRYT
jgi:hypothetical protein